MRVRGLSIRNFLSVGSVDVDLTSRGMVLVDGDNRDQPGAQSNGAGKSTIFTEALLWGLYGTTSRGVDADGVIHRKTGKDCSVDIQFECGGVPYRVLRTRKHAVEGSTVRLWKGDQEITASSVAETTRRVADATGLDLHTFTHTIVLGQGLARKFTSLTDADRKSVLEGILKLTVFDDARKSVRKVLADGQAEVQRLTTQRSAAEGTVGVLRSTLQRLRTPPPAQDDPRPRLLEDAKAKLAQAESELALVNAVPPPEPVTGTQAVADAEAQVTAARPTLRFLEQQVQEASSAQTLARRRLGQLEAELRTRTNTLSTPTCATCEQVVPETHRERVLAPLRASIAECTAECANAENAHAVATTTHQGYQQQFQALCAKVDTAKAEVERMRTARQQHENRVSAAQAAVTRARQGVAYVESMPAPPTASVDERAIQDVSEKLDAQVAAIAQLDAALAAQRGQNEIDSVVESVYQRARSKGLEDALRFLNERIAEHLALLSDGTMSATLTATSATKAGDTADKIGLQVSTIGGSYASASGGEADRIDFAIALAIHDLVCSATGVSHNLFVVDEPANFVDPAGLQRIAALLDAKLATTPTIIVVSQNPAFRGLLGETWVAVKEGGFTRLEGACAGPT